MDKKPAPARVPRGCGAYHTMFCRCRSCKVIRFYSRWMPFFSQAAATSGGQSRALHLADMGLRAGRTYRSVTDRCLRRCCKEALCSGSPSGKGSAARFAAGFLQLFLQGVFIDTDTHGGVFPERNVKNRVIYDDVAVQLPS